MASQDEAQIEGAATIAWSDAELASAVEAYMNMLRDELDGRKFVKAKINRMLREGPLAGRTVASIEFRMQNISAALYDLKMPRITGYLPAKNVGSAVKQRIIAVLRLHGIAEFEPFVPTSEEHAFSSRVSALRLRLLAVVPKGTLNPAAIASSSTRFVRDPAVKAWILKVSHGICEGCDAPAPFLGQDGLPYLEVHHVTPMSSGGSDRTTNSAALCPNCHRRCHSSVDRDEFKLHLYQKVPRLKVEVPEPPGHDMDEFVNFD